MVWIIMSCLHQEAEEEERKCRSHKLGTYVVRKSNQLRQKWGKFFENWSKNTQRGWEGNQEGCSSIL